MMNFIMRVFGKRALHKAVGQQAKTGGLLDMKLGYALFRDGRVPAFRQDVKRAVVRG